MGRPSTIAIDGPAASGKSTIGAALAARLGYVYFDTGVMYRAVTWAALKRGLSVCDESATTALAQRLKIDVLRPTQDDGRMVTVLADGQDITWEIRSPQVDLGVSHVSVFAGVRAAMTKQQRHIASRGQIVMVGRDIGTVVLPDADLKIYLDASLEERVKRRFREVLARDGEADYEAVRKTVLSRDEIDSSRYLAPLRAAPDAYVLDTTELGVTEVLQRVMELVDAQDPSQQSAE